MSDPIVTPDPSVPTAVSPERLYTELGATGLRRWAGSIYEERLKELQGIKGRLLLREMHFNDPVIHAVFTALEANLKRADWRVEPASEAEPDKKAARFLETCLFEDMSFSWSDSMSFILTMLEQGFSVLETVYKRRLGSSPPPYTFDPASSHYNDGRIGWRKWAPRPAESLTPGNEWKFDDSGGIQGINQTTDARGDVFIPIQKMTLYRTTVVPANNPEGMAIHRAMYIPWWYSTQMQEIEGIGVERDLAGIPIVYLGNDCSKSGPNSDYDMAVKLVSNLRMDEQAGVVIPKAKMGLGGDGEGMLVELLSTTGTRQHDTSKIIERYNRLKAVTILAQFILLGMERTGSYALARAQSELFAVTIQAWLSSIADTLNRYPIPRLFSYNVFPGITGLPKIVPSAAGVLDLEAMGKFVNEMVGTEVIHPDQALERHLRQLAGLPPPPPLKLEENPKPLFPTTAPTPASASEPDPNLSPEQMALPNPAPAEAATTPAVGGNGQAA